MLFLLYCFNISTWCRHNEFNLSVFVVLVYPVDYFFNLFKVLSCILVGEISTHRNQNVLFLVGGCQFVDIVYKLLSSVRSIKVCSWRITHKWSKVNIWAWIGVNTVWIVFSISEYSCEDLMVIVLWIWLPHKI